MARLPTSLSRNLCDLKQNGRLNSEQFALAMYFVNLHKMGYELPTALLPEMIPPTLRPKPTAGLETTTSVRKLLTDSTLSHEIPTVFD